MPADREIHFGYVGPDKAFDFVERIGCKFKGDNGRTITKKAFITSGSSSINITDYKKLEPKLRRAYVNTIVALGWKIVPINDHPVYQNDRHIGVESPWGYRTASPWDLYPHFDPNEMNESVDELTIGVNLSSRYTPTLLDIKDKNGTLGSSLIINKTLLDTIEICKRELIKEIPEMHDAEVYIREIFY
jgi:hypothetical protein